MKKIISIIIIYSILILQTNNIAIAQRAVKPDLKKQIEENYLNLQSPDFEKRYEALYFFNKLEKEKLNEEIFKKAADLFKIEIARSKKVDEFFDKGGIAENLPKDIAYINSEAYGMYHGYLCGLVGKSGDKSLLPLLVEKCPRAEVLLPFGDAAVEPLINIIFDPSAYSTKKTNAIRVLAEMLKPKKEGYVAKGEARNKIKKVLIQTTSDNDFHVRKAAVRALGDSEDEDVIPVLEKIAQTDPHRVEGAAIPEIDKGVPAGTKVTRYPVRMEAEKALKKLKEKKK